MIDRRPTEAENQHVGAHTGYRPEIDGLRALAVLPVVLFHAGVDVMSGGFVGVDIFFVISGFLITGILYREITERRFSILTFYQRRIRRIVPNLLTALLATTATASVVLIPVDLKLYSQSVVATVAFAANVFFWIKAGYFTPNAEQLPLLHMWSLGVEEQYYLIFPLLMVLGMWGSGRWLKPALWITFVSSLLFSAYQVRTSPDAAFYLPFSRLWELMVGSLLAVGAIPIITFRPAREALCWIGLAAIVIAIFAYGADMTFPGVAALLPCFGAVAILYGTNYGPTQVGRLMSLRPIVFIGTVSYSLYIWHWPIIVLTRYVLQRKLMPVEIILVLVATFVVAVATWKYIEQPLRHKSIPIKRLLLHCGVGAAVLTGSAALLTATAGWPGRYSLATRIIATAPSDTNPERNACDRASITRLSSGQVCRIGQPDVAPTFALVGDSYGDAMAPGVEAAAREAGVSGIVLTQSGCAPLVGVDEPGGSCRERVEQMYRLIHKTPSIRMVLLVARWPAMVEGRRFGLFESGAIRLVDDESGLPDIKQNIDVIARGFIRSIRDVQPAKVVILHGIPEQRINVPQAATIRTIFGGDLNGIDRAAFDRRQARTLMMLQQVRTIVPFQTIDASAVLCNHDHCPIISNGRSLYADDNHPTRTSAIIHRSLLYSMMKASERPSD